MMLLLAVTGGQLVAQSRSRVFPQYATGFTVQYHEGYTVATVTRPWPGAQRSFRYVLAERGTKLPSDIQPSATTRVIRIPVRSVVTMSTTFLPPLEELGVLDSLKGHSQTQWIYSPAVRTLVKEGQVKEIGSGTTLNVEQLLAIHPDVVFVNRYGSEWAAGAKLRETGVPVVVIGDWAETTPLGAAEWIKFISLFYDREKQANTIFDGISARYNALKKLAASARDRPTVFSNAPYQGQWTVPGGQSFAARLFADAGAHYLWKSAPETGSLTLDFESVYARAYNADFWLNPGNWNSLADGLRLDPRVREFRAFRNDQVYNNNARENRYGGIDYYESGLSHPDRVLADLIKIFHPGLLRDHALYYYRRLR